MIDPVLRFAGLAALLLGFAACGADPDVGEIDDFTVSVTGSDIEIDGAVTPDDVTDTPEDPATVETAADYPELGVETLAEGEGDVLERGQTGKFWYVGVLQDGRQFDGNIGKETPLTVKVGSGQVIKGWDLGLVGMKVGEKRRLTIPGHLAYGEGGTGTIGPNATLVFTVELSEIVPN